MAAKLYDVLVIGGGPSGLSVAVSLARQTYQAVVFDSGVYRNARATHMHNVAGFDHVPPAEYRAKVRADLAARYDSTTFVSAEVLRVERLAPDGPGAGVPASTLFRAVTADGGSWLGRKVVLATGVTDIPVPDIAGYDDCFGRGIFHCLFCHGYEERGVDSVGVFAVGNMAPAQTAMHIAYMAKPLGKHVRIYTHGEAEVSASLEAKAAEAGFALETRKIRAVRMSGKGHEVVITLDDGEEITEGFVVSTHPDRRAEASSSARTCVSAR